MDGKREARRFGAGRQRLAVSVDSKMAGDLMALRIGVDMVEVARMTRGVERHGERFYGRFFTLQELEQCEKAPARLAGRFAIKEAVGKAFGTGIGDVSWQEIEVFNDERGRPYLKLHGHAKTLAHEMGLTQWEISLTHTDTHAIGFVVATGS